jgi:hypothetical protein
MPANLDPNAIGAAFAQPNNDGSFTGDFADYLAGLGRRRPAIVFAFPPKAAGTFLRTAAVIAIDGQLMRIVHAQGERDAQPYLPLLVSYYLGGMTDKTLVTHVHMQALQANRHFLEAFGLKPIIMVRSIPDMLASYLDMLETDDAALADGLNSHFPPHFRTLQTEEKADYLIDILGPWYVGYYATWLEYAQSSPARVCVLHYHDLLRTPDLLLAKALAHTGLPRPRELCRAAIEDVWREKALLRFNHGQSARGQAYFSEAQRARIRRMLSYYPVLDGAAEQLAA